MNPKERYDSFTYATNPIPPDMPPEGLRASSFVAGYTAALVEFTVRMQACGPEHALLSEGTYAKMLCELETFMSCLQEKHGGI